MASEAGGAEARPALSKGAQTRRAILDAAIARFGREGYRATSVADIARDAALGGTVAYAYFPSKEALFLAAVDEDAASVIEEGLAAAIAEGSMKGWPEAVMSTLAESLERHPLARRLLSGREPEVVERVLEIPALAELRKACAERLLAEQQAGAVRADLDATVLANGLVSIVLALMVSVVQFGPGSAGLYAGDVVAVLEAALTCSGAASPQRSLPAGGAGPPLRAPGDVPPSPGLEMPAPRGDQDLPGPEAAGDDTS